MSCPYTSKGPNFRCARGAERAGVGLSSLNEAKLEVKTTLICFGELSLAATLSSCTKGILSSSNTKELG